MNLTDRRAAPARAAQVALVRGGPDRVVEAVARAATLPHLQLPGRHAVRAGDVVLRRLHGALAAAADRGPVDFAELLLTPGVGARTVLSLALAAEVIHGTPSRFTDPARFSLAHGGKDGHPFPVPLRVYDETLRGAAPRGDRLRGWAGRSELAAIRRLDAEAPPARGRGPGAARTALPPSLPQDHGRQRACRRASSSSVAAERRAEPVPGRARRPRARRRGRAAAPAQLGLPLPR